MDELKRRMLLRRAQLEKGHDEALAQVNANAGAIAEIDYWLKEMEHASQEGQIKESDL